MANLAAVVRNCSFIEGAGAFFLVWLIGARIRHWRDSKLDQDKAKN